MSTTLEIPKQKKYRPQPFLYPEYCKACARCLAACPKSCITMGTEIHPLTGLCSAVLDLEACNGCGLCIDACPEPFGLMAEPEPGFDPEMVSPELFFGERTSTAPTPYDIPDHHERLPALEPMILKGTHASAVGAVLAGCRHFFGYPITPSTEGAELLARLLPELDGVFLQAVSEVAAVNMMYGCGGAGQRTMTFTSSPGFSLMLEGISYMIGAEVPGVFVNIMRGGPGLGNIAPEQADIKLVCRGLGHGNTHAIVLAPSTAQEMLDLTMLAFDLTFKYRNPVVLIGDGFLGQITGKVNLPQTMTVPGLPAWAVFGDEMHRGNITNSIGLTDLDLEEHNIHLNQKYQQIIDHEQRASLFHCDDAEWIVVACNTPARMAKGAVQALRNKGIKAGLFRPLTLWPFPINQLKPLLDKAKGIVVVEAGAGQLEDELRLALAYAGVNMPRIEHIQHFGGVLPQQSEIIEKITGLEVAHHGIGVLS